VDAASVSETHYKNLLTKLPSEQEALNGAYEAIENVVNRVDAYVKVSNTNKFLQFSFELYTFG